MVENPRRSENPVCEYGPGAEPQLLERKGKSERAGREKIRAVQGNGLVNTVSAVSRNFRKERAKAKEPGGRKSVPRRETGLRTWPRRRAAGVGVAKKDEIG